MSKWFTRNIGRSGRIMRGVVALVLLVAGLLVFAHLWWLGLILLASGAFVLFEALRGWCIMRACGIKTRL